jgi:hypothetical protein
MKTILSKQNRPLRLSAIFNENGKYFIKILYLDTFEFQVLNYSEETILKLI